MKRFLITFLNLILCFCNLFAGNVDGNPRSVISSEMSPESRHINKRINVHVALDNVWQAWTTVEGVNSFFGNDAEIEMKIGGPYEIHFVMERQK